MKAEIGRGKLEGGMRKVECERWNAEGGMRNAEGRWKAGG